MATLAHLVCFHRKQKSCANNTIHSTIINSKAKPKVNGNSTANTTFRHIRSISINHKTMGPHKSHISIMNEAINAIKSKIFTSTKALRIRTAIPRKNYSILKPQQTANSNYWNGDDLEINGINISCPSSVYKSTKCIYSNLRRARQNKENLPAKPYAQSTSKISLILQRSNIRPYKKYKFNQNCCSIKSSIEEWPPSSVHQQDERIANIQLPRKEEINNVILFEKKLLHQYHSNFKNEPLALDSPIRMQSLLKEDSIGKKSEEISCCLSPSHDLSFYGH
jgi:hypothetical protein